MVAVETLVVTGICLFYLHSAIFECMHMRRAHTAPAPTRRDIRWRMIDYPILFVPPTAMPGPTSFPLLPIVSLDAMAPVDPQDKETDACSICLEEFTPAKVRKTTCGHRFCSECIKEWLRRKQVCPLCNTSLLPLPPAL